MIGTAARSESAAAVKMLRRLARPIERIQVMTVPRNQLRTTTLLARLGVVVQSGRRIRQGRSASSPITPHVLERRGAEAYAPPTQTTFGRDTMKAFVSFA